MTGTKSLHGRVLHSLLGRVMGRVSVAVVAAAAVALLAPAVPMASADPAGDADAAINQAYDAAGGPAGALGPKEGGVYPVGAGFGQNFAAGRIFFSPESGAHSMQGAILDKYLSLGGPGDGDLGFPNIDEGAGRAPNSRNTTFSAPDNPVIFWTPDTGAHVVRGAINAAWDQLGGSAGTLGVPTEDEIYSGDVVSQKFTGGEVSWNRKTKTFTTTPPELADQLQGLRIPGTPQSEIDAARRAAGGPLGPLGAAEGAPTPIGDDGLVQTFAGGKIFYSPATGANVLTGQVLEKYESVGGPTGDLGFPTSNEADGGVAPASRVATFAAGDDPVIFWTPDYGAVIVRGAINAAWAKLGGATGQLGAPTADQTENGDAVTQTFAGGAITFDRASQQFSTEPPNLASQLAGLQVPQAGPPQTPQAGEPGTAAGEQKWYQKWWWALAIVPVLILVGAVVAAVLFQRRRRDDREPLDRFDDHDDYDGDYGGDYGSDYGSDYDGDHDGGPEDRRPANAESDEDSDDRTFAFGAVEGASPASVHAVDQPYVPLSAWAMPADEDAGATSAGDVHGQDHEHDDEHDHGQGRGEGHRADLTEDQDDIDTGPIRIADERDLERDLEDEPDVGPEDVEGDEPRTEFAAHDVAAPVGLRAGEPDTAAAAAGWALPADVEDGSMSQAEAEPVSGPPSGRHAAVQVDEPAPSQTSLRLAHDDPYGAPRGYPVKADTKSGVYWLPGSSQYERAAADIWFASEEFALTNGFVRA